MITPYTEEEKRLAALLAMKLNNACDGHSTRVVRVAVTALMMTIDSQEMMHMMSKETVEAGK